MDAVLLPRLASARPFPWGFFGRLIGFGAVAVLFMFYFNRALAYLLTTILRKYLWHYYHSSVTIEAIQISPLAGRIFLKNVKYHGRNETISIAACYITWKYWSRRVLQSGLFDPSTSLNGNGEKGETVASTGAYTDKQIKDRLSGDTLPRIVMDIRGLEWFVYNRSPAYEAVLAAISKQNDRPGTSHTGTQNQATKINPTAAHPANIQPLRAKDDKFSAESLVAPSSVQQQDLTQHESAYSELPSFLRLLPIGIVCKKSAMVMGNDFTESILVATAKAAEGLVDARTCRPEDLYKQCFDFVLENFVVKFQKNEDYTDDIFKAGAVHEGVSEKAGATPMRASDGRSRPSGGHSRPSTRHKLHDLLSRSYHLRGSATPSPVKRRFSQAQHVAETESKWRGLSRYLDPVYEESVEHVEWKSIEYARVKTIADCPKVTISFFWDVPGRVTHSTSSSDSDVSNERLQHINNGPAPEWGFNINIAGGTVNYGPWADKQRANLQNVFFPPSYSSAVPAQALEPGQQRQSTHFKIVITLDDTLHLRLHTREESKDWKWNSSLSKPAKPDHDSTTKTSRQKPKPDVSETNTRQAGWLYLTIASNTSVTYIMDMLASSDGFGNKLELDAAGLQLTTSVNHGVFMSCKSLTLNSDLSNALGWNKLRTWIFAIRCNSMELFFLRDHAFLLTDLINDWTSGPPNDFMTFIPFLYKFNLDLSNLTVHLNVNDANIIDVPASLVDNAYLRFGAQTLSTILDVPATQYRPQKNSIRFDSRVRGFSLDLLPPAWNTLHSLLDQKRVGMVEQVILKGCYDYCTTNSPAQTDILTLDVDSENLTLHLYGFLVRHFMVFRENFFGDDMHFQTLEEYQHKLSSTGVETGTRIQQAPSKISNDLDVILTINVKDSCLILPSGIYSASEHIKADMPSLDLDLRFTNYYMDVDVSLGPISMRKGTTLNKRNPSEPSDSRAQLFLDGLWLTGHRLFGLPPTEPTYVCNWDFVLGRMIGECTLDFMALLAAFARAFPFQFKDTENALPRNQPKTIHDVTFLRVKMAAISLCLYIQESIIKLQTGDLSVKFDDLAGELFSERLTVDLPDISFAVLDLTSATRQQIQSKREVITHGLLQTSIAIRTAEAVPRFRLQRQLQQDHIRKHDSRTHRTPWFLLKEAGEPGHSPRTASMPTTMPIPPMPEPLNILFMEASSSSSSAIMPSSSASSRHRSSFLSGTPGLSDKVFSPTRSMRDRSSSTRKMEMQQNSRPSTFQRSGSTFTTSYPKLTVSSPYTPPHFQLQHVQPQTKDLPSLNHAQPKVGNEDVFDNDFPNVPEDDIARSTIMISCRPGIAAFFTLEALKCVLCVMEALQPTSPSKILDDIQMASLPQVRLGFNKPKTITSTQIRFELPQLAIRFITQSTIPDAPFEWQTYEAGLSSMVFTIQLGLGASHSGFNPTASAASLSLDTLRIAVRGQQSESIDDEARVQVNLESTTAWFHSNGKLTGRIQPDSLEIISLNRKVENLAAIVNNAVALFESITPGFKNTTEQSKTRQRSVVYFLSSVNRDLADPIFLNSASYIARATTEHARNSDTWKMASRLRHVLDSLSKEQHQQFDDLLQTPNLRPSVSQFEEVIDSFKHWRGWDLDHLSSSAFMRQVFDVVMPAKLGSNNGPQISIALSLDSILAVVDPGPMQNQVELQHIAVSADSVIAPPSENQTQALRTTTVSLSCNNTVIQLNWEILELVEGILRRLGSVDNDEVQVPHASVETTDLSSDHLDHKMHLVAGFETIDLGFKTINLEVVSLIKSLKTSAIAWQSAGAISGVNAMINTQSNTTRILSHSQLVLVVQLLAPFLHGALSIEAMAEGFLNLWTGGGFCQKLELEIHQDLLGLLGVADLLVRDEFMYVQSLFAVMDKKAEKKVSQAKKPSGVKSQHQFHVALLLENYRASIALLSTLHYVLCGSVARSMLQSKGDLQRGVNINFDVKQHIQTLENHIEDATDEIARFIMPPISARIILNKEELLARANVVLSLEKIFLDASAIHALFTTLSRREVSTFRKNVSRDAAILRANLKGIMPTNRPLVSPKPAEASSILFFAVEIAADGLEVAAVTGKNSKQPARLVLDIGPTVVKARNEDQFGAQPLAFIKADSKIQDIRILLERSNGHGFHSCGDVLLSLALEAGSATNEDGKLVRFTSVLVTGPEINVFAETAPTIVDILGYMQQKFKNFSLSEELHGLRARRNRTKSVSQAPYTGAKDSDDPALDNTAVLFNTMFNIELSDLQIAWRVGDIRPISPGHSVEDLVFSIEQLTLASRHVNSAQLVMLNLQLQMVPKNQSIRVRSRNSALMPEVLFNVAYVSTSKDRRFAFQAVGKSVDLRFTPRFVLPATDLQRSMALATQDLRKVIAGWNASFIHDEQNKKVIAAKRISSILIDANFAGAVINLQATGDEKLPVSPYSPANLERATSNGEPFPEPGNTSAVLRTPGIAFKIEYSDVKPSSHALSAEIRVDASSNTLQPSIVPLILELTNSIREVVHEKDATPPKAVTKSTASLVDEEIMSKPVAILGDCKLNLGLRICRQKFGLSCQPIAKVEARAEFDDIYITINTVEAEGQERFFALSARVQKLQASVQHTYSQEATGRFVADHIDLSLMNSRHVSDLQGISAILKFGPMKLLLNVRKLHDFLLFYEIWWPEALQQPQSSTPPTPPPDDGTHQVLMHRYQQVASTNPFPWSATIFVEEVDVELDLGQSLGKSSFQIHRLWTVSQKISNWEQNLHIGFRKIKLDCAGRLDCYLGLENLALRTSIKWPEIGQTSHQIPLIQASLGFDHFKIKAAFEYQSFLIGNFSSLHFLMYNVRDGERNRDRLVCMIEGDKIQAFCTTQSSASMLALYQAMQRLILEKQQSFENSLKDIQRYYRRTVVTTSDRDISKEIASTVSITKDDVDRTPLQLQTNVVISLKQLNIGAYPRSFIDNTIFKLEALDASARFSVVLKDSTLQSSLGMSLGQVRIALSNINRGSNSQTVEDLSVEDVVRYSTDSRGGTILKVPRVNAVMQTWQHFGSTMIEYIFRSSFEGKVEVGWNINRINVIRTMWNTHSKALASRLGKALPQSAVHITGVPTEDTEDKEKQDKITAVVNMPVSKYSYLAREPPIIETPQLRDMGEATPPLEWIGLQREKLPNVTHQIIIVPLLEVAKEVEDAYSKILGAS